MFLRPFSSLQVIIDALFRSLPGVGYIVVLLLLFFMVFGILGLNLFSGLFYSCNDATVPNKAACVGTFVGAGGILKPRVWSNPPYSFDSIGEAFLALFEVRVPCHARLPPDLPCLSLDFPCHACFGR